MNPFTAVVHIAKGKTLFPSIAWVLEVKELLFPIMLVTGTSMERAEVIIRAFLEARMHLGREEAIVSINFTPDVDSRVTQDLLPVVSKKGVTMSAGLKKVLDQAEAEWRREVAHVRTQNQSGGRRWSLTPEPPKPVF